MKLKETRKIKLKEVKFNIEGNSKLTNKKAKK